LRTFTYWLAAGSLMVQLLPPLCSAAAAEGPIASAWTQADNARLRLIAGRVDATGAVPDGGLFAGIQAEMAPGWKTYWRNPGSSGVPPRMDTSGSVNLASAKLLFPAPSRFPDRDGDTIGYKGSVIFPVAVTARDPAKPVQLELTVEFGICKDICIPANVKLDLTLPPDTAKLPQDSPLATALARVPRSGSTRLANDPSIAAIKAELAGEHPYLTIDAAFPGGARDADVFVEAPDGLWVPLPQKVGEARGDTVQFKVDLADGVDLAELKGKTLLLTLVSAAGQSEATFKLE
jgi:DsbC/DsbD-like thiol-disulfide interchange protein